MGMAGSGMHESAFHGNGWVSCMVLGKHIHNHNYSYNVHLRVLVT